MTKTFAVIFLFIFSVSLIKAQSQFGSIAKFGIAGGFSPMYMFPNVEPINNAIANSGFPQLSSSGMIAWGGSGYAYVLFVKNLRLGGMGYGGSTSSFGRDDITQTEVDYNVSGGAFTIEYTLPFIKKINVSVGLMIGGGSQEINLNKNSGTFDWNTIWSSAQIDSLTNSYSQTLKNSFFTLAPTLNLDIPLNRFMEFRIGGGYIFSVGNEWKAGNDIAIKNVPSDLNGNSFFIQTGIYFGFFAF